MVQVEAAERPAGVAGADPVLDRLLAEARAFSVEFPAFLANHLPMALVILRELGASDARLGSFFETYRDVSGLVPPSPAVAPIARERWTEALGDRGREADYRDFFTAETGRLGVAGVQRAYLPRLLPGIAASALHALMRLAYADRRGDPAEIGVALGAWAATYLPLGQPTGATPSTDDPAEVLRRLRADPSLGSIEAESDLLWHWMRATASQPGFAGVADWLRIGPDSLADVARAGLALYAGTMTFEALHAVTGAHWLRMIHPFNPDPDAGVRFFWQAVAAVYPKIGRPALPSNEELDALRHRPCPDWPEIKQAAIRSDDEHDISLVFSAAEEMSVYGDPLYRVVAARRVGLIP